MKLVEHLFLIFIYFYNFGLTIAEEAIVEEFVLPTTCEDLLSDSMSATVADTEGTEYTYHNCERFVKFWPSLCTVENGMGGPGARCCASCGDPTCLDRLTPTVPFTVTNAIGVKVITSCKKFVEDYTILCKTDPEQCCRSCEGIDLECLDGLNTFRLGTKMVTCAQYVKARPCSCYDEDAVINNCCLSCKTVDTEALNCNCRNKLDKKNVLSVIKGNGFKTKVQSCDVLRQRYTGLCREHGGIDGKCCKACTGLDLTCLDELKSFNMPEKVYFSCKDLVKARPCYCAISIIRNNCCDSCKGFDPVALQCDCQDTLTKKDKLVETIENEEGIVIKRIKVKTCKKMVKVLSKYPQLCDKYGQKGGMCCKSCTKKLGNN